MKNTMTKILFALLLTAACGLTIFAQTANWKKMPGLGEPAANMGIGANGAVWASSRDGRLYQWQNNRWVKFSAGELPGTVTQIAVDPNGYPWVVITGIDDADKSLYRLVNNKWEKMPVKAVDVSISPEGQVWIVGAENKGGRGDGSVYLYDDSTGKWNRTKDPMTSFLAAGSVGGLWQGRANGEVYRYAEKWLKAPGISAGAISVGANDSVWVISSGENECNDSGCNIYRYDYDNNSWVKIPGIRTNSGIAVDPDGNAWIVNQSGDIFMYSEGKMSTTPKPKPTKTKRIPAGLNKYPLDGDIPYIKISFKKGEIYSDVSGNLSNFDDVKWYSAEMSGKNGEMMVVDPEGQPEARGIHILVKDPLGEIVGGGGSGDNTCNNRVEIPQTSQGKYSIVITQCDADNSWNGGFSFRLGAGPGKLF